MSASRQIRVTISADTRKFVHAMLRTELVMERTWWRRLVLRWQLWRVERSLRRSEGMEVG
jgi:hypothetical protein